MPDNSAEEIVRTAVAQALERQLASFRESVLQEVLREVGPALSAKPAQGEAMCGCKRRLLEIQAGTTQKEILRALLDGAVLYCGRAALFVYRTGADRLAGDCFLTTMSLRISASTSNSPIAAGSHDRALRKTGGV